MIPKETRLDDGAEIYKKREPQSEKQKLSEMTFSEKFEYFKQYYFKKLLVITALVVFTVYLLITMFGPKPETVLSLAFVNYPLGTDITGELEDDLNKLYDVDTKNQRIIIDTSYDLVNMDYASAEKIMTYVYSGEIDIFIAPKSQFLRYAFSNTMTPLTDLLPTDVLSLVEDRLFECKTRLDDEETADEAKGPSGVFGIYVGDLPMFHNFDTTTDPPVLGVIVSGKNQTNSVEFIRHLFENK